MVVTAAASLLSVDVLLVEAQPIIEKFTPVLAATHRVNSTTHASVALEYIRRSSPALVVTNVTLADGSGIEVCKAAKALPTASTVLVTPTDPDQVPDALGAGCDGVLLKPFAPSLLVTRVSRLLRERSNQLRMKAARSMGKSAHLSERIDLLRVGTNQVWPNAHCPYCQHGGVTSFDYASMRRAWYACLECRRVWLAKRQD
jgi:DNA-binding response OmpR family regulator